MSFTPPVSQGDFHYANGDLYVSANPENRHRRATVPELHVLFHPTPGQTPPAKSDPPAHWYKAQLLHYGLKPSDAKGTAVKRLLDAVNSGTLDVPPHLRKLESDLKREWDANERKAKKAIGAAAKESAGNNKGTKGRKRKADGNDDDGETATPINVGGMNLNLNINITGAGAGSGSKSKGSTTTAGTKEKKTKLANDKPQPPPAKTAPTAQSHTKKQTAKPVSQSKVKVEAKGKSSSTAKPDSKAKDETKVKAEPKPKSTPKAKPPPKVESKPIVKEESPVESPSRHSQSFNQFSSPSRPSLGLLNGRYDVSFSNGNDGSAVLCLHGKSVWGDFHMEDSPARGVFWLPERPWFASSDLKESHSFDWRGIDEDGDVRCGNNCTGWICFLGGGRIAGTFCGLSPEGYDYEFQGQRVSGAETRAPRYASSMHAEFDAYGSE